MAEGFRASGGGEGIKITPGGLGRPPVEHGLTGASDAEVMPGDAPLVPLRRSEAVGGLDAVRPAEATASPPRPTLRIEANQSPAHGNPETPPRPASSSPTGESTASGTHDAERAITDGGDGKDEPPGGERFGGSEDPMDPHDITVISILGSVYREKGLEPGLTSVGIFSGTEPGERRITFQHGNLRVYRSNDKAHILSSVDGELNFGPEEMEGLKERFESNFVVTVVADEDKHTTLEQPERADVVWELTPRDPGTREDGGDEPQPGGHYDGAGDQPQHSGGIPDDLDLTRSRFPDSLRDDFVRRLREGVEFAYDKPDIGSEGKDGNGELPVVVRAYDVRGDGTFSTGNGGAGDQPSMFDLLGSLQQAGDQRVILAGFISDQLGQRPAGAPGGGEDGFTPAEEEPRPRVGEETAEKA